MRNELSQVSRMSSFIILWGNFHYVTDYSIPVEDYEAAVLTLNRCHLLSGFLTTSSYPTPPYSLA